MQVAKQTLHNIKRYAPIDQKTRKRMTQIVQAYIGKPCAFSDTIPRKVQRGRWPAIDRRRENKRIAFNARRRC